MKMNTYRLVQSIHMLYVNELDEIIDAIAMLFEYWQLGAIAI